MPLTIPQKFIPTVTHHQLPGMTLSLQEPWLNYQYVLFLYLSRVSADFLQSFVIDPQLMDHSHSSQISTAPQSSQGSEFRDDSYSSTPMGLLDNGAHIEQEGGLSPSKSSRDDRVRPTTYNPVYGLVEGVKRGGTDWSTYKKFDEYA
jgi:hypothetical protein